MTVLNVPPIGGPYVADGVEREWDYPFRADQLSHLYLVLTDPLTDLETTVLDGFSATGLGDYEGGTITYPILGEGDPLAEDLIVTVYRAVPYDQPTRIGNQGRFFPATHEDAFDYLSMQIQQLALGEPDFTGLFQKYALMASINYAAYGGVKAAVWVIPTHGTLPLGATGSYAYCATPGVGAVEYSMQKNGVEFGTIDFASNGAVGTFTVLANVDFVAGDRVYLVGSVGNGELASDFAVTLVINKE